MPTNDSMILVPGDPGDRVGHCGATDCAALICASEGAPYFADTGEWSVWASQQRPDLMPVPADREDRFAMGHHLESIILDRYDREVARPNGLRVEPAGGYIHAPAPYGWFRGQIDGLLRDDRGRIVGVVDSKATERPWEFWKMVRVDDEWTRTEVAPRGYRVQILVQIHLLRMAGHPVEFGSIAILDRTSAKWQPHGDHVRVDLDSAQLIVRDIIPDDTPDENGDTETDRITGYVTEWWERHVIGGEEPPNDSSAVCTRWRLYEQSRGMSERPATDEEEAIAYDMVRHKHEAKHHADEAKRLGNKLMGGMKEAKLTMGRPYVQIQAAGRGGKTLRDYRFPTTDTR